MNTTTRRVAAALVAAIFVAGPLHAQPPAAPPPVSAFFATEVLSQPLLSPDGKRLAVLVANEKTGRLQLGVIDLDAGLKPTLAAGYTDGDVHSVRVRETPGHGLLVNYHCRVDPQLDVATVHDHVDRLEQRVRAEEPRITRIVSHTEPLRAAARA